jgi:flagellar basal-body rod protein FlgC
MSFLSALRSSASGLRAQRLRIDVIANNVANAETTRTAEGGPFRRELAVFKPKDASMFGAMLDRVTGGSAGEGGGVDVTSVQKDESPFKLVLDPNHPDAKADGFVAYPNVNPTTEIIDMMAANRAYQANATVLQTSKSMAMKALEMGR